MAARSRKVWVALGVCVAVVALATAANYVLHPSLGASQENPRRFPYVPRRGVVQAFGSQGGDAVLTVKYGYPPEEEAHVLFSAPDVPRAYRGLVSPSWSLPCSAAVGTEVSVTQAEGRALFVLERSAPNGSWRPCYARLYFDLVRRWYTRSSAWDERRYGLGSALRQVSWSGTPLQVWIRGRAKELLEMYQNPRLMTDQAVERGQPSLAASIQRVHELGRTLQSRIILVRVIPFRYRSQVEAPVGGGWPYFVVALYEDKGGKPPAKLVDYSSDVR